LLREAAAGAEERLAGGLERFHRRSLQERRTFAWFFLKKNHFNNSRAITVAVKPLYAVSIGRSSKVFDLSREVARDMRIVRSWFLLYSHDVQCCCYRSLWSWNDLAVIEHPLQTAVATGVQPILYIEYILVAIIFS
jgi:hypothetical protein